MYEQTFRMLDRPFVIAPQADRYVSVEASELALANLRRTIERAEGPGLLIGPAGTGKTLLCQILAKEYRHTFRVALLACARLGGRRALLQNILFELGLPYRDMSEGELRLSLMDHLEPSPQCPNGMLLLVDEADSLPLQLLEEIRMMTNLVRNGEPRVRLVLAGGRKLEERFADPKMESFSQRIAARCYLQALQRDETEHYIQQQLASVGAPASEIFDADAIKAIHQATDGVPRLINQLCDHALVMAAAGGRQTISSRGIEEAWADLQQLPTQWSEAEDFVSLAMNSSDDSTVIEFGQLDADDEVAPKPRAKPPISAGNSAVISSATSAHVTIRLDDISEQVDRVSSDAKLDDDVFDHHPAAHRPAAMFNDAPARQSTNSTVEYVVGRPHGPFEAAYCEEEIVIDHYATLEAMQLQRRTRVTSNESREFAAALLLLQTASGGSGESSHDPPIEIRFDPASDPVLPEFIDERMIAAGVSPHISRADEHPATTGPHQAPTAAELPDDRDMIPDDRDMIIVEDDDGNAVRRAVSAPKKPRRQEYRQLFAQLRRG